MKYQKLVPFLLISSVVLITGCTGNSSVNQTSSILPCEPNWKELPIGDFTCFMISRICLTTREACKSDCYSFAQVTYYEVRNQAISEEVSKYCPDKEFGCFRQCFCDTNKCKTMD